MTPNYTCIKCQWVFKIKCCGIYCARLIAYGFSWVPAVDFFKNYSLVMNDIMFRVLLLIMIQFELLVEIVDTKTASLYGDLEEEIYMECLPCTTMLEMMTASF